MLEEKLVFWHAIVKLANIMLFFFLKLCCGAKVECCYGSRRMTRHEDNFRDL